METKSFFQNQGTKITLKLILIFILAFFLIIPQVLILNLIDERQELNKSVTKEVASGWANDQLVTGPALVIPYYGKDQNGKTDMALKNNLIIYPENLDIKGDLQTHTKYRSLYKVLLYDSKLSFKGRFVLPESKELNIQNAELDYKEAYIATGISDLKGIKSHVTALWSGQKVKVTPGLNDVIFKYALRSQQKHNVYDEEGLIPREVRTGLSSKVVLDSNQKEYDFSYDIDIKGSQALLFSPISKNTKVSLKSAFPDPSYIGDFLPEHTTNAQGFDARWNVLEYNKSLPPFQKANNMIDIGSNVFGVKIVDAIDNYSKTYRAGKYMILFVILTFLVVFLTEVVQKLHIHIFQYTLIGLALAIFFTLLLSISEFWGFDFAYSVSAVATIALIFLYSLGMFQNRKSSIILLGLLTGLFAYIYIIIQLEKTALLAGSIGLFVIIAATMYVTRKIRWFEENTESIE
jgi:inner membrane protein